MLKQRVLVIVILLPIFLPLIILGGYYFAAAIVLIMALAAWEYIKIMQASGYQPASWIVIPGVVLLCLGRVWNGFESAPALLSLVFLAAMTYHLFAFEKGRDQAATDMGVTLGGVLYLGWIGAYLISLRDLPDGAFWLMLALLTVWLADSGAYFIGKRWGRHSLSPRLSPKKTWEGFWAGVAAGVVGGALLGWGFGAWAGPESGITPLVGLVLGVILSLLTPLGDLGESMIKRQAGMKDSSNLLPGHGGVLDRIDSWLWAAVLSFYTITWFFL